MLIGDYSLLLRLCYNACCACCKPQSIDRETRTHRSNISTICGDSVIHEVIQRSLVDRLPRSKASMDQRTGRVEVFFLKVIIKYIEDNLCSICLVEYELDSDLVTLPCLHIFHCECTKQWIRILSFECPVCGTRSD